MRLTFSAELLDFLRALDSAEQREDAAFSAQDFTASGTAHQDATIARKRIVQAVRDALRRSGPTLLEELRQGELRYLELCCGDPSCDRCAGEGLVPVRCACGSPAAEWQGGLPVCLGCVTRDELCVPALS